MRIGMSSCLFFLATMMCFGSVAEDNVSINTTDSRRHLLLQVVREGSRFELAEVQIVSSPLPKQRSQRYRTWRYKVVDSNGNTLFERGMDAPGIVRGSSSGTGFVTSFLVSSKTADDLRVDRIVRKIEVIIKRIAATVVILVRKVAAPGLPKMVWLAPPKAAPIEAPFPACRSTMRIRATQTRMWREKVR